MRERAQLATSGRWLDQAVTAPSGEIYYAVGTEAAEEIEICSI